MFTSTLPKLQSRLTAMLGLFLVAAIFLSVPSDGRAARASTNQSIATADCSQPSLAASARPTSTLFADWMREMIGNRQRMIQISLIFVVVALFVIWWR